MKIVIDENVSLGLASLLRGRGFTVTAIAEIADRGMSDEEVWSLVKEESSLLIEKFISNYPFENYTGKLVTLSQKEVKIR
ncbi:MAG: DUF5615 family PIN-like protein [Bacteroidota bacterium]|nr:DUF5615 family PIN-like protein [Bacteroidota bacterium]